MVRVVLLVAGHRDVDRVLKLPSRVLELRPAGLLRLAKGDQAVAVAVPPLRVVRPERPAPREPGALDRHVEAAGDPILEQAVILHQALAQLVELLARAIFPVPAAVSQ